MSFFIRLPNNFSAICANTKRPRIKFFKIKIILIFQDNFARKEEVGTCWVSQQLAHMLRAGREEQEGAGRDSPALLLLADRHQELNRHLFIGDRYTIETVFLLIIYHQLI